MSDPDPEREAARAGHPPGIAGVSKKGSSFEKLGFALAGRKILFVVRFKLSDKADGDDIRLLTALLRPTISLSLLRYGREPQW